MNMGNNLFNTDINTFFLSGNKIMNIVLRIVSLLLLSMLIFSTGIWKVDALEEGVYLLKTAPAYNHPVTNEMEDPGKNPGIGQGMTESVLYENALYEVYPDNSKYITIRFALMDNITDVRISYQKKGDTDYKDLKFDVMQSNDEEHTEDMRFEIPDEDVVVRFMLYVEPMGRDVIFFTTFSDPKEGNGDFVTTEYVEPVVNDTGGSGSDGQNGQGHYSIYMTLTFVLGAALILVTIAFVGYVYYTRKIHKKFGKSLVER